MAFDPTTTITDTPTGVLNSQPGNINFLTPYGFRFSLKRSPNLNFYATDANIPSFTLGTAILPSPFKQIELPGDKPEYGNFNLTFKVDEDLNNYLEVFNWMSKIGYPNSFEQFSSVKQAGPTSGEGIVSDGTLIIMNSAMKPITEVRFENMFPTELSEVNFTTQDPDLTFVTATVTFRFNYMKIVKL